MKAHVVTTLIFLITAGCMSGTGTGEPIAPYVPAQEFTRSVGESGGKSANMHSHENIRARMARGDVDSDPRQETMGAYNGDPRYLSQGYTLRKSVGTPAMPVATKSLTDEGAANPQLNTPPQLPHPPSVPPGSRAPYYNGQMTSNPSLWPDDGNSAALFKDFRAFQSMDLITIVVNESSTGKKNAVTETESEFSILAGISNFFGIETRKWAANNDSLDPSKMISATTETEFKGDGETQRSGSLRARISAVIMEMLPNGLLRIEGTKIVSINSEEEIMVISGLVRQRDVTSVNEVDSGRIANMRIDFYGRGVIGDEQAPGWGARIIRWFWPF